MEKHEHHVEFGDTEPSTEMVIAEANKLGIPLKLMDATLHFTDGTWHGVTFTWYTDEDGNPVLPPDEDAE